MSGKNEGPAKWYGPVGEVVVRCGDWQVRAEQGRNEYTGERDKWSVFCLHKTGVRVPPGPNSHVDPTSELERLERMLDWNRGEPRGFSWIEDGHLHNAYCTDVLNCSDLAEAAE